MGIFDKAREAPQEHVGSAGPVVDRLAAEADQRGGGTHRAKPDRAAARADDRLDDPARRDAPPETGRPA